MKVEYTKDDMRRALAVLASSQSRPDAFAANDPTPRNIAQLIADVREECAVIADDIATGARRMPGEKAVAATIAKRIRGGGR